LADTVRTRGAVSRALRTFPWPRRVSISCGPSWTRCRCRCLERGRRFVLRFRVLAGRRGRRARAAFEMTASRVCPVPDCPVITDGGPCEHHRLVRARQKDARRPSRNERGYGARWNETRARFLATHPRCERCGAPATDVHHRDRVGPLGPRGHDPSNFEALCHSCHSRIP
jgi:5-methylcytosine-specific restriction protein A